MSAQGDELRADRKRLAELHSQESADWATIDELKADLGEADTEAMDALASFLDARTVPLDHGELVRWLLALVERSGREVAP